MKKIITLAILLFSVIAFAQAPNKMSYQSVIRDNKGVLLTDKKVTIQISILRGSEKGEAVYVETHKSFTNSNGLVTLEIGTGENKTGKFSDIDWANGSYFIKTATDSRGETNFDIVGVSELLSVPYALHAKTVQNAFSGDFNDLRNKPTKLSQFENDIFFNNQNSLTVRPTAGIPSQTWSLFGNSNSDPNNDKLGTTDYKDLVMVTNNLERLRITADGDINLANSLQVGKDLTVKRNVYLNTESGATINNGNFTVANTKATLLTGTLNTNGATDLDATLNVDGVTNLNSAFNVNNTAPSHLTGLLDVDTTLNVDGATTLQSNLDVKNGAPTHLTGVLNVDGATDLNSTLNVNNAAATHLTGTLDVDQTLNVDGATTLQSNLDVKNAAATNLTGVLNVDGATDLNSTLNVDNNTTLNGALNANGQVTISTAVDGGQDSYGAYPLRVEGSAQGIAIKLSADTPNNDNNFITFLDAGGNAKGRIEGQTLSEFHETFDFIYETTFFALDEAFILAEGIACGVQLDAGEVIVCAVEGAELIAHYASWQVHYNDELGIVFESGGADYAEWLEKKSHSETFSPGDIVAVSGGKITKDYDVTSPSKFMVVSTNPIVVGNMKDNSNNYARVAFMGQVPVKVRGEVKVGDYILASSLKDGVGVAMSPEKMDIEDYKRVAGIAWSSGTSKSGFNMVNMAVGINTNDLADKMKKHQEELTLVKKEMNTIIEYLKVKDPSFDASKFDIDENQLPVKSAQDQLTFANPETTKMSKVDALENVMKNNPQFITDLLSSVRSRLDKLNVNYNKFEQTRRLVSEPDYLIQVMREMNK